VEHFWEQVVEDAQQRCSQICGDLLRPVTAREHYLEEPCSGIDVAAFRDVHVDDLAVLVNGAIHVPPHTSHPDVGFVDEPAITNTVPARPSRVDDQRGEALHPPINRHVINVDTAFREQFFDVTVRQAVAEVPADGQQDEVRREPKSSERNRSSTATADHPCTLRPAPDPSTQQCQAERLHRERLQETQKQRQAERQRLTNAQISWDQARLLAVRLVVDEFNRLTAGMTPRQKRRAAKRANRANGMRVGSKYLHGNIKWGDVKADPEGRLIGDVFVGCAGTYLDGFPQGGQGPGMLHWHTQRIKESDIEEVESTLTGLKIGRIQPRITL
jgi:hypothetical protein